MLAFYLINIFPYFYLRASDRDRDPLSSSPWDVWSSWSWARPSLQSESYNSVQLFRVGARDPSTWKQHLLPPAAALAGNWNRGEQAQTQALQDDSGLLPVTAFPLHQITISTKKSSHTGYRSILVLTTFKAWWF